MQPQELWDNRHEQQRAYQFQQEFPPLKPWDMKGISLQTGKKFSEDGKPALLSPGSTVSTSALKQVYVLSVIGDDAMELVFDGMHFTEDKDRNNLGTR